MSATTCRQCGAKLALQDMTRPSCPCCGTLLPHHARAAEHAVLVDRILEQRIGEQSPGAPPPQIGYHHGAQLHGLEQHPMGRAMQGAGWITVLALLVALVCVLIGIGAWLVLFLVR